MFPIIPFPFHCFICNSFSAPLSTSWSFPSPASFFPFPSAALPCWSVSLLSCTPSSSASLFFSVPSRHFFSPFGRSCRVFYYPDCGSYLHLLFLYCNHHHLAARRSVVRCVGHTPGDGWFLLLLLLLHRYSRMVAWVGGISAGEGEVGMGYGHSRLDPWVEDRSSQSVTFSTTSKPNSPWLGRDVRVNRGCDQLGVFLCVV